MVLLVCLSAVGSADKSITSGDEEKEEIVELGEFYTLELAYEYGWLDCATVKSYFLCTV